MSEIITPSKNTVLLEPIKLESMGGGILEIASVSNTARTSIPQVGKVLAIGKIDKKEGLPIADLKVGETVAYRAYGDARFLIGGREIIFVVFGDLLGRIKK